MDVFWLKNIWFIKVNLIEFRLQFRHSLFLSHPIWRFVLVENYDFDLKNIWFIKVILIKFRLQFRHTLSLSHPILRIKSWNVLLTSTNYVFLGHFEVRYRNLISRMRELKDGVAVGAGKVQSKLIFSWKFELNFK